MNTTRIAFLLWGVGIGAYLTLLAQILGAIRDDNRTANTAQGE